MIRTQVQLSPEQMRKLEEAAARQGRSVAELVREGVDSVLREQVSAADRRGRAAAVSGRFRSGLGDVSRRHDDYLPESLAD